MDQSMVKATQLYCTLHVFTL